VLSDGKLSTYAFKNIPGFEHTYVWTIDGAHDADPARVDAALPQSALPPAGGSLVQIVSFPPTDGRARQSADPKPLRGSIWPACLDWPRPSNPVARRCTPRRRSTTRSSSKVSYGSNSMTARRCISARAISWFSRRRDTGGATKANVRQPSFFSCSARNLTTTHETESCDPDKPSFVHTRRRTHLRTASLPHHPKGHELCAQP
jgi:hypothetical protein